MFRKFLQTDGLSLERLHTLVLIAEAGSLKKASGGDPGRQSRMSHHLRELSDFFHIPLTQFSGRVLILSPKGVELAQIARHQLSTLSTFKRSADVNDPEWKIGAGDSVLQWWIIPALGRSSRSLRWVLRNLRTSDIVSKVANDELDFGVVRTDAVNGRIRSKLVGTIKHTIVVPRRLLSGNISTRKALTELPHATIGSDGQLTAKLRKIASNHGGVFEPKLKCDSLGLCLAAVRTGKYAAVLPTYILDEGIVGDVEIVDADLIDLNRPMALIWNQTTLDRLGRAAEEIKEILSAALLSSAPPDESKLEN